jgi:hypothetical protein
LGRAAAGAKGEGQTTLRVGDVSATREPGIPGSPRRLFETPSTLKSREAEATSRRAALKSALSAPSPVDPFTEPTEGDLYKEAERRVSAAQEAEDRRTARKEKLGKFMGTMAAAFGRKPGTASTEPPTPPINGAR